MLADLFEAAGFWFWAALGAVFLAAVIDQAGAPRSPDEEPSRPGAERTALAFAALLTPGLLLLHAFFATAGQADGVRMAMLALPIAAMIGGAIVGGIVGMATRGARVMLRMASVVAGLGALIVAVLAALPSIGAAWAVAQRLGPPLM